jgi:hypothetical protein
MTSVREVATSSQDARVTFKEGDTPEDMASNANDALLLIRDDIQRLAAILSGGVTKSVTSGNHKLPSPGNGIADVWAVSDTATTGSTGGNYHTLTLYRNGAAANTMTYDTRRTEVVAYQGGNYLGQATVGDGDLLTVNLATTGAPTALTAANLSLRCKLRES